MQTGIPKVDTATIVTPEAARTRIRVLREAAGKSNEDWAITLRREAILVQNRLAYLTAQLFVAFDDGQTAVLYGVSSEVDTQVFLVGHPVCICQNPTEDEGKTDPTFALVFTSLFYIALVPGIAFPFGQKQNNGRYANNTMRVFASEDEEQARAWVGHHNRLYASASR